MAAKNTTTNTGKSKKEADALPADAINVETGGLDDAALLAELLESVGESEPAKKPEEIIEEQTHAPDVKGADEANLLAELESLETPPPAKKKGAAVKKKETKSEPTPEPEKKPESVEPEVNPDMLALADVLDSVVSSDTEFAGDNAPEPEPEQTKNERPKTLRDANAKKSEKINAALGEKASEFLLLEIGDADLSPEELAAKQKATLAAIDKLAKKVGEKSVMLFSYMRNGGRLNEVMRRAFEVLLKDGELTSGDKGNLQLNLMAKPYSLGTARSQSNQIFSLFPALKITIKSKGRMVPNPDSIILEKFKSEKQ